MAFIIHKAMVEGQRSEGGSFGKGKRFQGLMSVCIFYESLITFSQAIQSDCSSGHTHSKECSGCNKAIMAAFIVQC